jgi:hypothetical protein
MKVKALRVTWPDVVVDVVVGRQEVDLIAYKKTQLQAVLTLSANNAEILIASLSTAVAILRRAEAERKAHPTLKSA